jgi:hypothetical protein
LDFDSIAVRKFRRLFGNPDFVDGERGDCQRHCADQQQWYKQAAQMPSCRRQGHTMKTIANPARLNQASIPG